jgi:peptide chain release factor subunit 3
MNPNAHTWVPNATAAAWQPPGAAAAVSPSSPTAVTTDSAPADQAAAAVPVDSPPQLPEGIDDPNDPLWLAILQVAQQDMIKATALLNDPDQLAAYPEIMQLLNNNAAMEEAEEPEESTATDSGSLVQETEKMQLTEASPAANATVHQGDTREHLNLVFIGHVDAGKSTLSGNILYLTENVDKRTIERYEREAKERNRESWFLAFIMDTNEEERTKGITVEVGKAFFESAVKRYTILDAPGHKNYIPNMIQGASQADVGLLVISARKGEFEAGFDRGGQSREHAMLAKTLGVSYLIVVVNKMDENTVQWKKERFDEIVSKIKPFLKGCGFIIKKEVKFIPISGLSGANVKEEVDPAQCSWWKKCYTAGDNNTTSPTLFSLLDSLEISGRNPDAPLRIPVLDRYTDRGTIAMGKVESGTIRPGMKVTVMPTKQKYKIDEVYIHDQLVDCARPGENVLVKVNGAKLEDVQKGFVICTDPVCRAVDKIICQIGVLDLPDNAILSAGFQCMFHAHTEEQECVVSKIFETTNVKTKVTHKAPSPQARFVTVGMRAVVQLQMAQTIPIETFETMSFMGRFTLRTEGKTCAIGTVIKLPPRSD